MPYLYIQLSLQEKCVGISKKNLFHFTICSVQTIAPDLSDSGNTVMLAMIIRCEHIDSTRVNIQHKQLHG